jgi:hypothetical protein
MLRLPFTLFVAILVVAPAYTMEKKPAPIPVAVYVTSIGAMAGMTDPSKDNRDAVKHLRNKLGDFKKDLRLVDNPEDATIILIVHGFLGHLRDRTISVQFKAGQLATEMTASAEGPAAGAWPTAAYKIAEQVREWVIENRDKLTAK